MLRDLLSIYYYHWLLTKAGSASEEGFVEVLVIDADCFH